MNWEADERRSALAQMTDAERVTSCGHNFGRTGECAYCPTTAEEAGY